jgi:hypothetical protein
LAIKRLGEKSESRVIMMKGIKVNMGGKYRNIAEGVLKREKGDGRMGMEKFSAECECIFINRGYILGSAVQVD